jgi:hypothetical protein
VPRSNCHIFTLDSEEPNFSDLPRSKDPTRYLPQKDRRMHDSDAKSSESLQQLVSSNATRRATGLHATVYDLGIRYYDFGGQS